MDLLTQIASGAFDVVLHGSLIGIACLWVGWVRSDLDRQSAPLRVLSWGAAFTALAIICMLSPTRPVPGLQVDIRATMVALATIFGGVAAGAIVAAAQAALRFWIGGTFALTGVIGIGLSFLVSALFVARAMPSKRPPGPRRLMLLGLAVGSAGPLASFVTFDPASAWQLVSTGGPPQIAGVALGVVIFAVVIIRSDQARRNAEKLKRSETRLLEADRLKSELLDAAREKEASLRRDHQMVLLGRWHMTYGPDGRWQNADMMNSPEFEQILNGGAFAPDAKVEAFVRRLVHPDDVPAYTRCLDQLGDPEIAGYVTDYRIRRVDGTIAFIHEIGESTFDARGRLISASGVSQDVTESRRAETELRRLLDESARLARLAQESNRAKSEFLATMSHELRTPLNAIIGFSELLLHRGNLITHEKRQEYDAAILQSGRHLLSLINDILDLAKVEAGKLDVNAEWISLPALVAECVSYLEPSIKRNALQVEVAVPDITIRSDRRLAKQVLLNVLSNAVKFSKENGKIGVTAARGTQTAVITVEDAGIGMEQHEVARALEAFVQLESSYQRTQEGTGLGLALVQRFTTLLGGAFRMTSTKGVGTVACIELPVDCTGAVIPAVAGMTH